MVNLPNRELTYYYYLKDYHSLPAATPNYIDVFALRKNVSDFVRRLRLKEHILNGGDVGGDFSDIPVFRQRSTWCPARNRDLVLETYGSMLKTKIFFKRLEGEIPQEDQQSSFWSGINM